jgi:predicted metalloprotease with PDZ domain
MTTSKARASKRFPQTCVLVFLLWLAGGGLAGGPLWAGDEPCDFTCSPCLVKMVEHLKNKGWVGIEFDVDQGEGWRIKHVVPMSPAAAAGLKRGDWLVALDGVPYDKGNKTKLEKVYKGMKPGATITYSVKRADKTLEIAVKLGKIPEPLLAQWIGQSVLESYAELKKNPRKESKN